MPSRPACQLSGSVAKQAARRARHRRAPADFGEGREDVREEQLLVLLLMVDAELDEIERGRRKRRQRPLQRRVDMTAIGAHLVERRPAEHAAPGTCVARAFALVIAVEQDKRSARRTADSRAHDRAARRSRRTRSCERGAIWPATRRGTAGSPRRRRSAARRGRASAGGSRTGAALTDSPN